MQLARKFLFAIVSVAIVVLAIGVWASLRSEAELHAADIRRDHQLLGQMLGRLVERIPPERLDVEGPEIARFAFPGRDHMRARLVRDGDPAAPPADEALFRAALDSNTPIFAALSERTRMFVTVVPLSTPGAAVELAEPVADDEELLRQIAFRYVLISLGLTVGFVLATSYLGRRFIGGPMKLLVSQARRIGAGHLDEAKPLRQKDEIGELARELNAMAVRLREANERARAENEKRLQAVEQLRHADRLATVGTLASGIAHELGTPLAVVQGRAALVAEASSDADVQKSARVIGDQVHRMTRIIRQVLDFARRSTPKPAPARLADLVEKPVGLLSSISKKHGVEILLGPPPPISVMADRGLMHQVFTNLLMNAVQASAGRPEPVQVRFAEVSAAPPGEPAAPRRYGRVEIEDHGKGIPQEQLLHVFEPFFTTKDVGEGTGLGLSVAWGIVQDHGGWIEVDSEVGKGSTFRVYLPLAADAPPSPEG